VGCETGAAGRAAAGPGHEGDAVSASAIIAALERGEIDEAAELYEQSGRAIAEQLLGTLQQGERRLREAGVRMYVKARDFARAARIHEQQRFWPDAAKMYDEAGDAVSAARCWRKAGEPRRAARALDAKGAVDEAVALYQELGDHDARAACLARAERWVEA